MNDNPLKTIQKTESELKQKIQNKKTESENKIADFKREQEKALSEQFQALAPELKKIKAQVLSDSKKKITVQQKNYQSEIDELEKINKKLLDQLADKIVSKVAEVY